MLLARQGAWGEKAPPLDPQSLTVYSLELLLRTARVLSLKSHPSSVGGPSRAELPLVSWPSLRGNLGAPCLVFGVILRG